MYVCMYSMYVNMYHYVCIVYLLCICTCIISGVPRGGAGGPWPPGASLGGVAGPACRGEF